MSESDPDFIEALREHEIKQIRQAARDELLAELASKRNGPLWAIAKAGVGAAMIIFGIFAAIALLLMLGSMAMSYSQAEVVVELHGKCEAVRESTNLYACRLSPQYATRAYPMSFANYLFKENGLTPAYPEEGKNYVPVNAMDPVVTMAEKDNAYGSFKYYQNGVLKTGNSDTELERAIYLGVKIE